MEAVTEGERWVGGVACVIGAPTEHKGGREGEGGGAGSSPTWETVLSVDCC